MTNKQQKWNEFLNSYKQIIEESNTGLIYEDIKKDIKYILVSYIKDMLSGEKLPYKMHHVQQIKKLLKEEFDDTLDENEVKYILYDE